MKKRINTIKFFIFILSTLTMISCDNDKPQKQSESKPQKQLTQKEEAELERASFDKLPNHNDSISGCWLIDKKRSAPDKIWGMGYSIDGFFFFEEHKRFSVFESTETASSESALGFYRFYYNRLTFEITDGQLFLDVWELKIDGDEIVAKNINIPDQVLYLKRTEKKSALHYK
ncbi:MAG TPA: hypothetical protein VK151_05130 [Fluviicola sp.]|nr:hypothetical protein [Fluviicola sp.]